MNYLLALAPIFCYVLLTVGLDTFQICQRKQLLVTATYGVAVAGMAWCISWVMDEESGLAGVGLMPLIEELLKGALLVWLAGNRRMGFFAEGILYGATIGAGFALVENLLYVSLTLDMTWLAALVRGFSTALLHIGCTALVGAFCVIIVRELQDKRNRSPWWLIGLCYLPSVSIHTLHNMMLIQPFLQMLAVIVGFLTILILLSEYDKRLIAQWLDKMVESEITLLSHVQHGTLLQTHAGKYLMSLHSSFSPEEIADILACLVLHLKLAVAAKSRLMLKEAQMAPELTEEERTLYQDQLVELQLAGQRIGKRGNAALSHIVIVDAFDQHVRNILFN